MRWSGTSPPVPLREVVSSARVKCFNNQTQPKLSMGALIGSVGVLGSQRSPIPQDQQATLRPRGLSFCRVALAEAGEGAGGCSLGAVGRLTLAHQSEKLQQDVSPFRNNSRDAWPPGHQNHRPRGPRLATS
jgi:hypothetical protein